MWVAWDDAAARRIASATFLSPSVLAERGTTRRAAAALVAAGDLIRLRNGRSVPADTHPRLIEAGRLGGRLDCVSLLYALGVFVRATGGLHVQFEHAKTRLPVRAAHVRAHWRVTDRERSAMAADIVEALAQACRCQKPRDAVATLDNARHVGLVDDDDLAAVFLRLPRRLRFLQSLMDARSESGPETLVRLLLRGLGCTVEVQVQIDGVGRVDLLVDGWLIVECDSRAHHEGWEAQKRDRRRDVAAAALGYMTVRPIAEDILNRYDEILGAMKSALHCRAVQNSTDRAAGAPKPRRSGLAKG